MLLQLGMMMLGFDDGDLSDVTSMDMGEGDLDGASEGSGLWFIEMISIRTLAAAVTFFGIVGGGALAYELAPGVAVSLGLLAGYGAMYTVYWAFKQIFKLEVSGHTNIQNAIGLIGQVYVPIDPGATGKIQLRLQGRTTEYQAQSDARERLATGAKVVVTEIVSSDTLRVEPVS